MPAFPTTGGITPKAYIDEHFSNDPVHRQYGTVPLPNLTSVTQAEVIAAGLSAGYGKKFSWSRTYVGPVSTRTALYGYLRRKLETVLACVEIKSGNIRPRPFWRYVEPSEKAGVSFNLGSLGAALAAERWTQGAGHTVSRFLHTRLFIDASVVKRPLTISLAGDKFPDYLVQDSGGGWHVFEAKGGGDGGNRWKQLAQGLQQAVQVTSVGENGSSGPPLSAVCVQTLVRASSKVEFTLVDPPISAQGSEPPSAGPALEIQLVPEIGDLLLALEAIEWFSCLTDPVQLRIAFPELVMSKLLGFRVVESAAFGGVQLALPEDFFDLAPRARAYLGVVEHFRSAAELAQKRGNGKSSPQELTEAARSLARKRKVSTSAETDGRMIEVGHEALDAALDEAAKDDFYLWQSNVLRRVGTDLGLSTLSARVMQGRSEARERLSSIRAAGDATGHTAAVSAGGLVVLLPPNANS